MSKFSLNWRIASTLGGFCGAWRGRLLSKKSELRWALSVACSHQAACAHWAPRVWSRAMGRRGAIVLLLGVLIALTPLAQASPPDPTWIPGFYDDADYDDVVLAITGAVAVGESGVMDPVGPGAVCLGPLIPSGPRPVAARALDSHPPRAPPHPLS